MHHLPQGVRIPNLKALDDAIADENYEYAILLNGGCFSRKFISKQGTKYIVENCIDDTTQRLTAKQMMDKHYTNIGVAMKRGALVTI